MIVTRLAGGLGNQMFHYATARNFCNDDKENIFLDTYLLQPEEEDIEKIIQRPYALDIYRNLRAKVDEKKISNLLRNGGLINRIKRKLFLNDCIVVEQKLMERVPLPPKAERAKNMLFIGNFQSENYFKEVRKELLLDFAFPAFDPANQQLEKKIRATTNSVSIHIRRGDYLSSSNKNIFTSVNVAYYNNAVDNLLSKLGVDKLNAFIFTDDIDWVKKHFGKPDQIEAYYVTGNSRKDSWKDMALMTACDHHIIANSSFSWWGAWLSTKGGINIAPKHWFLPNSYAFDINDIIPETWSIVDYPL